MEDEKKKYRAAICLCIDIRKSTEFHTNFNDMNDASGVIKEFMEEIYRKTKSNHPNIAEKFLYAGDGMMFISYINNDWDSLPHKFIDLADILEEVIKKYEDEYREYNLKIGIGIDSGDLLEWNLKDVPTGNGKTPLYVGYPVSRSTKLCKITPINWKGKLRHISLSKDFYERLNTENKKRYKLTVSQKRAMKYG